jgi:membrane protein DedA with SNARE-associated domain
MSAETLMQWVSQHGYAGIFFLLMLGIVGLPVPDEPLLAFAGYLVFKGRLHLAPTLAAAFLGSVSGVTISFTLGRTAGTFVIERFGPYLHLTGERIEPAHQWFERLGKWALMIGYFIPGIRHLTAVVAGSAQLEPSVFALYAYTGGLIWSATFIASGYFLGEKWNVVAEEIRRHFVVATCLAALLLIVIWLAQRSSAIRTIKQRLSSRSQEN